LHVILVLLHNVIQVPVMMPIISIYLQGT